jgi:hypothetical protein
MQTNEYSGKSMSGRKQWQEKHKKGKFSSKFAQKRQTKKSSSSSRFDIEL